MVHVTAKRISEGDALRKAMFARGTGLKALALRTRAADPDGRGISFQLVGFLATRQKWARETTSVHTAELIEAALEVEPGSLFEKVVVHDREGTQPDWEAL